MSQTQTAAQTDTNALPYCKACHTPLDLTRSRGEKNGYTLVPCAHCDTITVNPFPSLEQLIAYYQAYRGTPDYKTKADKKIQRSTGRVKRIKKYTDGKKFLDVGCNCGFTVKAALNEGLDAKGIDIDADTVKFANDTYGAHFAVSSVEDYAAQGHKADIVYTSEVIEHVLDPDGFVKAIADILTPGGVLYLTTPQGHHWTYKQDISHLRIVQPPEHITYFSNKGIALLLEKHGIKFEKFQFSLKPGIRLIARKVN
jgi:SAM-dependent methyltransferase